MHEPMVTPPAEMLADLNDQIARLRNPAGYLNAGLPNYNHLFGRDACVSALQLLGKDPTIAIGTLRVLARHQGQRRRLRSEEFRGKILHEHFPDGRGQMLSALLFDSDFWRKLSIFVLWRFPYYGSVDAGAWYMLLLYEYVKRTSDVALVRELWPTIIGIDHWLRHHAQHTKLGLVGFRRHYIFGLRNQSWKDNLDLKIAPPVAMIEVQGYYYQACRQIAELAESVMHDAKIATSLRTTAANIKTGFEAAFTSEQGGMLPLAVNGQGRPVRIATSNPGHLLMTGLLEAAAERALVARLFQADLWTDYGIRTQATSEPTFDARSYHQGSVWPFDNWVIYRGLVARGYTAEAARIRTALLLAYQQLGRIPELYAVSAAGELTELPTACTTQAWSVGALYDLFGGADFASAPQTT